jgi:hypothetical protein
MCSLKNNPFKFASKKNEKFVTWPFLAVTEHSSLVMVRDGHDHGWGLMVQSQFNPLQFGAYFINPVSFLLAYRLVSFLVETYWNGLIKYVLVVIG